MNAEEQEVHRIAYTLKTTDPAAVEVAAREMARMIDGPCWLVPVPTSRGSIATNLAGGWGSSTNVNDDNTAAMHRVLVNDAVIGTNRVLRLQITRP